MSLTTFFQMDGMASVVWDGERDCALAEFSKRQYETDDARTIGILTKMGYPKRGMPTNYSEAEQMAQIEQHLGSNDAPAPQTPQQMAEAVRASAPKPGPAPKTPKPVRSAAKPAPVRKAPQG